MSHVIVTECVHFCTYCNISPHGFSFLQQSHHVILGLFFHTCSWGGLRWSVLLPWLPFPSLPPSWDRWDFGGGWWFFCRIWWGLSHTDWICRLWLWLGFWLLWRLGSWRFGWLGLGCKLNLWWGWLCWLWGSVLSHTLYQCPFVSTLSGAKCTSTQQMAEIFSPDYDDTLIMIIP